MRRVSWEDKFVVVSVSTVLKNERVAAILVVMRTPCNEESILTSIVAKVDPEREPEMQMQEFGKQLTRLKNMYYGCP